MHGSGSGRNSTVVASSVAIVRAVHGSGRSSTVVASFVTAVRAVHGSGRSSNRAL